jgi:integrase/recombinase XerD
MNTVREAVTQYLAMRRALGFKLEDAGAALFKFVSFLEERGASYITTPLALEWAQEPSQAQPSSWAQRLSFVRCFARYRSATDVRTEVPAADLLPHRSKRAKPYLYSDAELVQLLEAALNLQTASILRRRTLYCLFGLLAVSGMRVGEAIDLKIENVDLQTGVLTVERAKFGKSRLVPIHASTTKILSDYICFRDKFLSGRTADHLFITRVGTRLDEADVGRSFRQLSRQIGLRSSNAKKGPRIHDMRHRFAHETLLRWYQSGEDAERRLPVLSTYLGHVNVNNTYWYLTAFPELMRAAVERLEKRWEVQS